MFAGLWLWLWYHCEISQFYVCPGNFDDQPCIICTVCSKVPLALFFLYSHCVECRLAQLWIIQSYISVKGSMESTHARFVPRPNTGTFTVHNPRFPSFIHKGQSPLSQAWSWSISIWGPTLLEFISQISRRSELHVMKTEWIQLAMLMWTKGHLSKCRGDN